METLKSVGAVACVWSIGCTPPQVIKELDSNKTVVSMTSLPLLNYTVSMTVDAFNNQHFTFSTVFPGGAQVFCNTFRIRPPSHSNYLQLSIRYSLFDVGQTLNSSGISFDTFPNDLKFEMVLSGWPFAHLSNTLCLHLLLAEYGNALSGEDAKRNQRKLTRSGKKE